jgi:hypothetical protein
VTELNGPDPALAGAVAQPGQAPLSGCLQVLGPERPGRTIRLDKPVTRFGREGSMAAMISRREDGYYLCHLEGDESPRVNGRVIEEQARHLQSGDRIRMGGLEFRFFLDRRRAVPARGPVQRAPDAAQRQHGRVALHTPAILTRAQRQWATRLIDISLSGALLAHPSGWGGSTGEHYRLGVRQTGNRALELEIEIRQIRTDRLGVAFHDLDDTRRKQIRGLVADTLGARQSLRPGLF